MPDYATLYDDYWSRADRWRSSSFGDAGALADEVARLGGARVLDVGCGMGDLVAALRARGADACGIDVARRTIDDANRRSPGCFRAGSILEIPWPDGAFDTVACTDVLEHLAEADVPRALGELHRVTRRWLFATIATRPDRDGVWHLTVRDRPWWEEQLAEAGFTLRERDAGLADYEDAERRRLRLTEDDWWVAVARA